MKNALLTILFIGITFFSIISFLSYEMLKKRMPNISNRIELLEREKRLLREGLFSSYLYEDDGMINLDSLVENVYGEKQTLISIIKQPTLVYFTNYQSCPDCFSLPIQYLKKNKKNFVIGIGGMDKKQFRSYVNSNNIESRAFLLPDGYFNGFGINPSLYFVLDNKGKYYKIFTPCDKLPYLTIDYLEKIRIE